MSIFHKDIVTRDHTILVASVNRSRWSPVRLRVMEPETFWLEDEFILWYHSGDSPITRDDLVTQK